jgi:hypothetical protein
MRLSDYDAYLKAQDEGWGQEFLEKLGRAPTTGGRPGGRATSEGGDQRPVSVEEMGYEKTRRTVEESKKGEANAATRASYIATASEAPSIISDASALKDIAKTHPQVFGMLQKPGLVHAFFGLIQEGVQTPGGSINVPGLDAAARKIFGTQGDLDAAVIAGRFLASMELGAAKSMLKGQGAVSDMERRIVKDINGSIKDSAVSLMAKADFVIARANFDIERRELYTEWEDAHPNKSIDRFEISPEYKTLVRAYNNEMRGIGDKYLPNEPSRGATTKQPAKPRGASPMSNMYNELGG